MSDETITQLPLNPGTDGVSRNLYALIFNGLTHATAGQNFIDLRERERISRAIYDTLRQAGVAVRFVGLEQLREAAQSLTFTERRAAADPSVDHDSHSQQWVGKCPECPS
jgi:hypothetical protein